MGGSCRFWLALNGSGVIHRLVMPENKLIVEASQDFIPKSHWGNYTTPFDIIDQRLFALFAILMMLNFYPNNKKGMHFDKRFPTYIFLY